MNIYCPKCKGNRSFNYFEEEDSHGENADEFVCESCGSAYGLEYCGYYKSGSTTRIDEGFEDDKQKKIIKDLVEDEVQRKIQDSLDSCDARCQDCGHIEGTCNCDKDY